MGGEQTQEKTVRRDPSSTRAAAPRTNGARRLPRSHSAGGESS